MILGVGRNLRNGRYTNFSDTTVGSNNRGEINQSPHPRSGRFRNRFIGLRASDEEAELIAHMAQISGMCKQDYIISRALERTVVVEPSVKVEKALRKRLEALCSELQRLDSAEQMTQELQEELATVLSVCYRLGQEKPAVNENDRLLNYQRASARMQTRANCAQSKED